MSKTVEDGVRVYRSCAYGGNIEKCSSNKYAELTVEICECNQDGCNKAVTLGHSLHHILLVLILSYFIIS